MEVNSVYMNARKTHSSQSSLIAVAAAAGLLAFSTDSVQAQKVDRSTPPALAEPRAISLPPVQVRTLTNGIRLMVVERHELPIVDIVMVLKGSGASANPAHLAGLSDITSQMIMAGTSTRSALDIDDQVSFLGVSMHTGSGWDATTVTLTTPSVQLDDGLELMADVLLNPTFPAEEFERMQKERLTALLQLKDRPSAIADRMFQAVLFGEDHAYGRPASGDEKSIQEMSVEAVKWFYDTHYAPNTSTIVAVGDITADELEARINALFGAWERKAVPESIPETISNRTPTTIYLVDKPGAAQSSFRIGTIGTPRSTPDFFPIEVANTILGGSFTSRLNMNLRETKGFTYGAGSRFEMRAAAGPFVARSEIIATMTDSALLEFIKELTAIRDTVPAEELQKAKQFLELTLPATFESTADVARRIAVLAIYDLPLDYYDSYSENIRAVSQADVERVARKYIDPEHLVILIVGDRETIEPKLRELNIAPVEVREIEAR